jgi:hypothetical protein
MGNAQAAGAYPTEKPMEIPVFGIHGKSGIVVHDVVNSDYVAVVQWEGEGGGIGARQGFKTWRSLTNAIKTLPVLVADGQQLGGSQIDYWYTKLEKSTKREDEAHIGNGDPRLLALELATQAHLSSHVRMTGYRVAALQDPSIPLNGIAGHVWGYAAEALAKQFLQGIYAENDAVKVERVLQLPVGSPYDHIVVLREIRGDAQEGVGGGGGEGKESKIAWTYTEQYNEADEEHRRLKESVGTFVQDAGGGGCWVLVRNTCVLKEKLIAVAPPPSIPLLKLIAVAPPPLPPPPPNMTF